MLQPQTTLQSNAVHLFIMAFIYPRLLSLPKTLNFAKYKADKHELLYRHCRHNTMRLM